MTWKQFGIIAGKNAVRGALTVVPVGYHFNTLHWTKAGVEHSLAIFSSAILANEVTCFLPLLAKWANNTTNALRMLLLILMLGPYAFGQSAPATQSYSFSFAPISLPGNHQTLAGTEAGVAFPLTTNLGLGPSTILCPGQNFEYFSGRASYLIPQLATALNNLSPKLNGFRFQFGATASTGVDRIMTTGADHYGFTVGGFVNYQLSSGGMWTLGAQLEYAKFPGLNNNALIVALSPAIHF